MTNFPDDIEQPDDVSIGNREGIEQAGADSASAESAGADDAGAADAGAASAGADDVSVESTASANPALDEADMTYSEDELLHAATSTAEDVFERQTPPPPPAGSPLPPQAPQGRRLPPPPPQPAVRRLQRSRHQRKIAGVSGGIAEYFGIDPTLVRLVTVVLGISGMGVFAYLLAWIIMPLRPAGEHPTAAPGRKVDRQFMTALGVAALAMAVGIAASSWTLFAIALVVGGWWLLSEQTPTVATATAAAAPVPPGYVPSAAYGNDVHEYATPYASGAAFDPTYDPFAATSTPPAAPVDPYAEAAPKKPRRKQRITWTVLSVLALLAAVGLAASTNSWWGVSATGLLGVGIVVIGVGVVAGQIAGGGARGLIPLGLLAGLLLIPVSAVDGLIDDGVGEVRYTPTSIEDLQSNYQYGIGHMVVDLSQIDFANEDASVDIELGIGELEVILPADVGGSALLETTIGELDFDVATGEALGGFNTVSGEVLSGVNVDSGRITLNGDNGEIDINVDVGVGAASLRSAR